MKKTKIILIGSIFLILIVIVFAVLIVRKLPNNIFCFLDIGSYAIPPKSIEVNLSNTCGQSFTSNFDNLFMISVFIPSQDLAKNDHLYFHLKKDKNDDTDLVTLKWRFNEIRFLSNNFFIVPPDRESTESGFHFHFQFPAIRDSKNKKFYFYFESPDTNQGQGIKLGFWDNRLYYEVLTEGKMFINHKPIEGFLAFRTYNTWIGNYEDVFNEILLRLSKDIPFLAFYGCLLLITFIGILLVR